MKRGEVLKQIQRQHALAYKRWGIDHNPFVKTAPSDHVRREVFTDRVHEMKRLVNAVLANPHNILVFGQYGVGKTVFILESLNELASGSRLLPVYTALEGDTPHDFNLSVLLALTNAMKGWDTEASEICETLTGETHSVTTQGEGGLEIGTSDLLPVVFTLGGKGTESYAVQRNAILHPYYHIKNMIERAKKRYDRIIIAVDEAEKREPTLYHSLITGCRATFDLECSFILTGGLWATWLTRNPKSAISGAFSEEIKLEAFDRSTAQEVIIAYLNSARSQKQNSCFPFKEEAVEYVIDISGGVPRQFNQICYQALNIAIEIESHEIDRGVIAKALQETGYQQYANLLQNERYIIDVIRRYGGTLSDDNLDALQELGANTVIDLYLPLESLVHADILVKKEDIRNIRYEISPTIRGIAK